ncbi:MAG: hypothetical protein ACKPJJ_28525 [Planctomycetaceae bacterium]
MPAGTQSEFGHATDKEKADDEETAGRDPGRFALAAGEHKETLKNTQSGIPLPLAVQLDGVLSQAV